MENKAYIGLEAWDMGFDAHMTLTYLGRLDKDRADYIVHVMKSLGQFDTLVTRSRITVFSNIPVVTVTVSDSIIDYKEMLAENGILTHSRYSWNPHISLKLPSRSMHELKIPYRIRLTGPYLKFEGQRLSPS